jgi:endonuclease YncB( thermonuclease family)
MPVFTVTSIIDGDTFEVSPQWKWNGESGKRVRPTGYDAPERHTFDGQAARDKLSQLILGKGLELREAYRIDRGRLVCAAYMGGKSLAEYFPNYR